MSHDHATGHGPSGHGHDADDATPLLDALQVVVPTLVIMGSFAFTVYLLVSASVSGHH